MKTRIISSLLVIAALFSFMTLSSSEVSSDTAACYFNVYVKQYGNCSAPQAGASVTITYTLYGVSQQQTKTTDANGLAAFSPQTDVNTTIYAVACYGSRSGTGNDIFECINTNVDICLGASACAPVED